MSLKQLVIGLTILGVLGMALQFSVDTDTWWHLRAGRWIVENKQIPTSDPFSFTRKGAEWRYPGWLMELVMIAVYSLLGIGGLNLMTAIFVAAAFVFVWLYTDGNVYFKAFLIIMAAAASGVYWAARPYILTFFLAAVYFFILERERTRFAAGSKEPSEEHRSYLWLLPVLMVIWANSHGGFAVGVIIYGVYWIGLTFQSGIPQAAAIWINNRLALTSRDGGRETEAGIDLSGQVRDELLQRWIRLSLAGLALIPAISLNPAGPRMLLYPFSTIRIEALGLYIEEWQSPDFHDLRFLPFLVLLLVSFVSLGASGKRAEGLDLLSFAVFGYLALTAGRNAPLFSLAAPIWISNHAPDAWTGFSESAGWLHGHGQGAQTRLRRLVHGSIFGLAVLAVIGQGAVHVRWENNREYLESFLPVKAVEYLREKEIAGRMYNDYNWGGYLMWALPEKPVFIDGRTDLYGDRLVDEWLTVAGAQPGWQGILDKWDIRVVLVPVDYPVAAVLRENGWDEIYQDDLAVILSR